MSLVDDISNQPNEQLAVLYCDLSRTGAEPGAESELALWRVNYFRAAREVAADHGGQEATTSAGGWIATFGSTVDALVCARALSSLVGWRSGGPSLSGGLSAGEVVRERFGIDGSPVREAIALCRWAQPRQVLIADPLKVVVARDSTRSLAAVPLRGLVDDDVRPALSKEGSQPSIVAPSKEDGGPGVLHGRMPELRRRPEAEPPATPSLRLLITAPERTSPETTAVETTSPETTADATASPAPAAGLRLAVLGWVQLEGGRPAPRGTALRGSQARAVLSMLALRRGPVHKQELAELVWPEALPDHWDGALRGIITKIRRFLAAGGIAARDVLVAEGGYYELRLPAGVTVDRDAITGLLASAQTALAENRPERASSLAHRAATILERHLLSGPDNAWFDQVRSELATERLTALELCARADLALGAIDGAKRAATEALALDRYRESSYRLLMQAHSAAGSRGEALRTYEQCRGMLAEELGVGPAPQTQALYIHLLG